MCVCVCVCVCVGMILINTIVSIHDKHNVSHHKMLTSAPSSVESLSLMASSSSLCPVRVAILASLMLVIVAMNVCRREGR